MNENHYSWRDSFDNEELDEQLLGAIKKVGSAVGSAVGGAVQKVGSAMKSKPIQGRVSRSNQNMAGKPTPSTTQTSPTPQAKPAAPQVSNLTKQGQQRTPAQMAAAKRIAAKEAGTAVPQLSGREKAQQMARARIAAKKVESNTPIAQKPTVDKIPQSF